jgi:hypothetical protein
VNVTGAPNIVGLGSARTVTAASPWSTMWARVAELETNCESPLYMIATSCSPAARVGRGSDAVPSTRVTSAGAPPSTTNCTDPEGTPAVEVTSAVSETGSPGRDRSGVAVTPVVEAARSTWCSTVPARDLKRY